MGGSRRRVQIAQATVEVRNQRRTATAARRRAARGVDIAATGVAHARRRTGRQPGRDRAAWADVAGVARAARRRHRVARYDGRTHGDPVRARARPGGQGRPRHDVAEGHRLRDGGHRCPDPGPDPGAFGDRGRGTEPPTSTRRSGRPVGGAGGEDVDRPPRRRDRQGHRRPGRVPRPRHDAAPADRRCDGRREVERSQLHHHVTA